MNVFTPCSFNNVNKCFFKAGAQNVPRLAECLLDAHKFLTITQVALSKHQAALRAAHRHSLCLERIRCVIYHRAHDQTKHTVKRTEWNMTQWS